MKPFKTNVIISSWDDSFFDNTWKINNEIYVWVQSSIVKINQPLKNCIDDLVDLRQ